MNRIGKVWGWVRTHWGKCLLWFVVGIVVAQFFRDCSCKRIIDNNYFETPVAPPVVDTVTIKKPYKIPKVISNNIPVKRKLYVKKNIPLRDSLEKTPIITHVEIKPGEVDVDVIDTAGNVKTEIHRVDPEVTRAVEIGPTGEVEEKKKTKTGIWLRKAGKNIVKGLAVVGAVAIVLVVVALASK